ncbi:hypothetical protein HPB52_015304 [Rhipicephalus sanguineus]|uniref:Protein AATF n=1 Tax=Rhipicephalus sanguineus TaxID=34632 RepID=A0A9D4SMY6_RHISA|nr:hypothetical protein HPB52_015304 [Rhipicephalus sanguineus]
MDNFSAVDVASEIEKGKAVHSQLQILDTALEIRVHLQKLVVLANQLPKHNKYALFRAAALQKDENNGNLIGHAKSSVEMVMRQLLALREELIDSHPEIRSLLSSAGCEGKSSEGELDSECEEIPTKRRRTDVCVGSAAEFWKKFEPYRNATIQKWHERTKLLSGKVGRSFASLEESPVKQIEHILMDEERLLRRTQTKRSSYKILGAEDATNDEEEKPGIGELDDEIFDDDDFYHHLLREVIERKTVNIDNPIALSRQWLEIEKLRKKAKRRVDTRATKGRKIRTELFRSLFGQKKYAR